MHSHNGWSMFGLAQSLDARGKEQEAQGSEKNLQCRGSLPMWNYRLRSCEVRNEQGRCLRVPLRQIAGAGARAKFRDIDSKGRLSRHI